MSEKHYRHRCFPFKIGDINCNNLRFCTADGSSYVATRRSPRLIVVGAVVRLVGHPMLVIIKYQTEVSYIYIKCHVILLHMLDGCVAQPVITLWHMRKSSHNTDR